MEADGSRVTRVVGKPGGRPVPALVTGRSPPGVHLAQARLVAGLADRRAGPAPGSPGRRARSRPSRPS